VYSYPLVVCRADRRQSLLATEEVTPYPFQYAGKSFILVDTPGFDDSRNSDNVIANRLLEWLRKSMNSGFRLTGIIYIHRIVEPRMRGTALSNMNMFRRLCGPDCFANVVLATSFWNEVDPSEGARRENELWDKDEFWGSLVKRGSRVARIGLNDDADRRLLLTLAEKKPVTLQAQAEMQSGKTNSETSAAKTANSDLIGLQRTLATQLEAERQRAEAELSKQERKKQTILEQQKKAFHKEDRRRQEDFEQHVAANAAYEDQYNKILQLNKSKAAKQDAELEQLRRARRAEADHSTALREERLKQYKSVKCTKSMKHCKIFCNRCRQKIKHKTTQFYRKHPFKSAFTFKLQHLTWLLHRLLPL
jgi:hypothetical protein